MKKLTIWIKAIRLRTLPLALSSAILGSFLAFAHGAFHWHVLLLATLTTLFLQILSNLANDYGDAIHGADNDSRIGPRRITQSGLVTRKQMRSMIVMLVCLALISGSLLIFTSLSNFSWKTVLFFFILGLSAIYAAIKYTIGKNPYGYIGLGDIFVFIYFGIVGVAGTYYLHVNTFDPWILLPASAIGLLSSGVLNLNNMRDIENDARSGKRTLVVHIGSEAAKFYHMALITLSILFSLIYTIVKFDSAFQLLFILTCPLFALNVIVVMKNTNPLELNRELKKLAFSTFVFSITFGIGLVPKMIKAKTAYLEFMFQRPATTSRGTHLTKKVHFIILYHSDDPSIAGVGECSLFPGLSYDDVKGFKQRLAMTIDRINEGDYFNDTSLIEWPSINFALETAWKDLRANGSKILFPSGFTEGKDSIWINGLIWMSDKAEMVRQIRQKLNDGFTCLKMKIGSLDLRDEIEVLKYIRQNCDDEELEIRLDANGSFSRKEALEMIKILSEYHLHSIEQPIPAGHWEEMAKICELSPVPIALDEDLIGKHSTLSRKKVLETIKPQYAVLKPGLLGGLAACQEWVTLADQTHTGWWITSSLETNIGLNAIAQWTYTLQNQIYHGLSTGSLYKNNIHSPLYLHGERLYHDPERKWDLSLFELD